MSLFFRTHRARRVSFDAALAQFGVEGLIEITNLMRHYALLAFNVNAVGVELTTGIAEAPLPI